MLKQNDEVLLNKKIIENEKERNLQKISENILPLTSDVMFKIMLDNENHKEYLAYFLKDIINKDVEEITKAIRYVKNDIDKEKYKEKSQRVDLIVEVNDRYIVIEMNNQALIVSLERNNDYIFRVFRGNIKTNEKYDFKSTTLINIINYNFEGNTKPIRDFQLVDKSDGTILTDKIKIYIISIPLIKEKLYNKTELKSYEKLLLVGILKEEEIKELTDKEAILRRFRNDMEKASTDDEVLGLYDYEVDQEKLRLAMIDEIEKRSYNEGMEKGIEKEKIKIVKNLLKTGMDIEKISEITSLSIEEIKSIN